ncbi:MAG: hypothetical protein OXL37_16780 [Chloroflexota bacterium]|nr:hypothetical protein [Chloroflexota bacterium]MDE2960242.1 hypothetical protein [Chloroflexota bacterium]
MVLGRRVYNFLYRVVIFAVATIVLGAVGILLGFVILFGADLIGLDEKTKDLMKASTGMLYVLLVISSLLFAVGDLLQLLWYYLTSGVGRNGTR